MSETTITTIFVAFVAAIPPTLVAWASLQSSKRNAAKADTIIEKASEIHVATNSNLTKATTALEVANATIDGLQKTLASMVDAKRDAQAVAMKPTTPPLE